MWIMITSGEKVSDVVREKLLASGDTAIIPLRQGGPCTISLVDHDRTITSDKLNGFRYELSVFDVIVELLQHSRKEKREREIPADWMIKLATAAAHRTQS